MKQIKTTPLRLFAFLLLTITFLAVNYGISMGAVWRVDGQNGTDPSGCSGGDTWPTALKTIKKAVECVSSLDEIWVKEGTYVLSSTIKVKEAVSIYGCFLGNETQRNQRDCQTNITTVDGDNGGIPPNEFYGGCFVLEADTTLDGLRINNCYGESCSFGGGGAICNLGSSSTITNCTFEDNMGYLEGGAIYNDSDSSLTISNCEFYDNDAYYDGAGGAIFNSSTDSHVTIDRCEFVSNYGGSAGGAISYLSSSSSITDSTFYDNFAGDNGGAISGSVGIITNSIFSANGNGVGAGGAISGGGVITNSIFNKNLAGAGGAIWINTDTSTITNCTFYDNYAPVEGGNAILNGGSTTITNSIFWRDSVTTGDEIVNWYSGEATVTHSDIYGGYPGAGNIEANPLFLDTSNDDFHLNINSTCIDAGTSENAPATDIDGDLRPQGPVWDIGADEYPIEAFSLYVDGEIVVSGNGTSWAEAFKTIQEAIDAAGVTNPIWVKKGTYSLSETININKAVSVYGGFDGTETELNQRDLRRITKVDGQDGVRCFTVNADATIDGFTIVRGYTTQGGGGISIGLATATVSNCIFSANQAGWGGGLSIYKSPSTISNCIFDSNSANNGAGIHIRESSSTIINSTFSNNYADFGGAIMNYLEPSATITNCILWGDTATTDPEIYNYSSNPTVRYCDIDQDGYPGSNGNIREDPLFVDPDNGDFHMSKDSPCIDAATSKNAPYNDIDGDLRPLGLGYDIGADEYAFVTNLAKIIGTWSSGIWFWDVAASKLTQMTPSTPTGDIAAGDFTNDGKVDVASIWPGGLWYQDGDTLAWTRLPGGAANKVTAGDVTGDGRAEIIGTWSSGIWYWDVAASKWTQMTSSTPTGDIAAGDFTNDGKADVASIWPGGLWYQDGDTLAWTKLPGGAPNKVTAGDVTGDGRAEIIGTWSSGIWLWDVAASKWTQMTSSTPTGDIAAGDFTSDGKADVASSWDSGLWYQDGATLDWTKVSNTAPTQLTAG